MRKRIISMLFVLSAFIVPASVQAQWVVSDPGNLVQGIVNSVNENSGDLGNGAECPLHMEGDLKDFRAGA